MFCQPPAFLSTSVNLCQPQTGCNPFATGRFVNLTTYFIKFVMYKPCEITNSIVFFRITCTVQTIFAIDNLHKKINLYNYDLVVMPESSSKVNQYMLRYIYRFAQPTLYKMTLVKALPSNISFDMKAYEKQYLDDILENGMPRYSPAAKEQAKSSINAMLEMIHQQDYFTIAKDVKKSRLRPYIMNFLRFESEEERELCSMIRQQNVLVIDDVTTSGSTLNEVLRILRILNEDNEITIFSLIGRNDLMAESM